MAAIFSHILNMTTTGSVVILLVMLVRLLLMRSPKIFSYALWSVVLFRLLCPVAFTAPVSVLDVVEPEQKKTTDNTSIVSYIPGALETQADFIMVQPEEQPVQSKITGEPEEQLLMIPMHAAALVWAVGMVGMLLYSVVQYLALCKKLVGSVQINGNIYLADHIDTAFVVGLVQPRIYLPSTVPFQERYYILAHEQHHIRRGDHIIKLLAYLALCIHWFNPLVWIAFVLAGKDMEMSCDEAVIKKLGADIRADYSASLLRLTTHKKILSGMPLAFGEGDTKGRVLNMAKWKKPAKWVVAICVILCLCVVVICAFNPEEGKSIEDLTRRTSDGPVGTGIGDLSFTYPAGLTNELREVENWTREEQKRILKGLPNRGQFDNYFIDNGVDFGGVVDFIVPEDREIHLEELNLPSEWMGLDYVAESSSYPYAEREYTLIKDGKDYIQLYLYTYSGRGYFLWFYTDQGNPAHKQAILESVELGSGEKTATKLKQNEEVSLGQFNITILKGYGYHQDQTVILEITRKERFGEQKVVGCVTARPNPNLALQTDADWVQWVEAVGLDLHRDDPDYGYTVTDNGEFGDISLTLEEMSEQKLLRSEQHYFYIAGDIVYHLWFDAMEMNWADDKQMLQSIWIKEAHNVPAANKWMTAAGVSPVQIGKLPDGYNYGFDGDQNLVFAWGNSAVGGVKSYPIPEGLYDPEDGVFLWLEEMGIPDFEDPKLIYLGGITSGDNGWAAEFADTSDPEAKRTVHRRHTFLVAGDMLYDIWFDLLKISFDTADEIRRVVIIPQPQEETENYMPTVPASDVETDTQLVAYGSLNMLLPSGFAATQTQDVVVLTKDSVAVGGIRHWKYPEFQPSDIVELKKEESGAPIGYMSGSSAYGDMEYEIFWDGNPDGLCEQHTFFIDGDTIYDVWYDENQISDGIAERFLKTVAINADPVIEENPDEQVAFAKCRAVLEAVQSGCYKIVTRHVSGRGENIMAHERIYTRSGEDWHSVTNALRKGEDFTGEEEFAITKSALRVNGKHYNYTGTEWVEIADVANTRLPWLAKFTWDENIVAYMDTLTDENGECVMLRVDEPYIDSDEYDPHYFLYFNFDPDGNFVNAQLQVNLFRDDEISITESIVSLDAEEINAEIQKEYQKAIG